MEANEASLKAAISFARNFDYDIVEYIGMYKDCATYHLTSNEMKGTISGFPQYCLVRDDYKCRLVTPNESLEIMALKR